MARTIKTVKTKAPARFMSIDASTQSLAFSLVENGHVIAYGKVKYEGSTLDERVKDVAQKTYAFFLSYPVDTVVIEDTVFINSRQTVTLLSKCHGALLAAAYLAGVQHTHRVSPIAWQSYIGNGLLTPAEKRAIKTATPNKSASWYKAKERSIRKQKTIDTVNKRFGFDINDDDIADSSGLAVFALENWQKVLSYGKK